jgi:TatD DNase family protein
VLDAHLHLCDDILFSQAPVLIEEALKAQITQFLCVVTNNEELKRALDLKKKFPMLKIAASTTPHDAMHVEDLFFEIVSAHAKKKMIQAIGETGLEYFHKGLDKELQKAYLHRYIQLALETDLPLIFHCREAFKDLFKALKPYKGSIKGMVHCFTGTYEEALEAIDLGLHISISGIVTFRNSTVLQTLVEKLPLSSILIETDSPYLAPLSQRGKTNKPLYIKETYQRVAQLKKVSVQELERHVETNFIKIF